MMTRSRKVMKAKAVKEKARKLRKLRKAFIEKVVLKSQKGINRPTTSDSSSKLHPKPPPQATPLPNLVISEKTRKKEQAQLKHAVDLPHFMTTKIKFNDDSRMPGIEDMRGIATEMDAGEFVFIVINIILVYDYFSSARFLERHGCYSKFCPTCGGFHPKGLALAIK